GYSVQEVLEDPEKCFNAMTWTARLYQWDPLQTPFHTVWGAIDFGGRVRMPKGEYESSLIILSHPVQSEKDLENLQMPNPRTAGRIQTAMGFAKKQAGNGLPVFFFSRSPFTLASNICGLETFCRWMFKNPEACEKLIEMALEHTLNVLAYWVESFGAENLFVWMSNPSESNQVISPKHMSRFALPHHIEYQKRLKEMGITKFGLHMCGDQNANLPYFSEADCWPHPAVLSFGHEVEIEAAAKSFPEDIIFGNLEPNLLQMETPNQIYERCKNILAAGKKAPGGFIMGPGCGIPATAPPVNVFAMTHAVNDFGRY
ncbi:MAG: hypothetical protein JRJ60_06315, partial [Deltaproteobacteria bacterium]|nr:hypothetical protein [Deltaproteobacteria bacterium]